MFWHPAHQCPTVCATQTYRGACWQQCRHGGNMLSCDEIFNSCAVWEPCPRLVLADGCLSARELQGGGGADTETLDGWVGLDAFTNRGRWQDVWISNREFASCFAVPAGVLGSTASLAVTAHAAHTGRERVTLLSPGHIEKAAEKRSQQRRGNAAPRGISPLFFAPFSDKALRLTVLSFLPRAYFIWLSFNGFFVDNMPLFPLYFFCSN